MKKSLFLYLPFPKKIRRERPKEEKIILTLPAVGDIFIPKSVLEAVFDQKTKTYEFLTPFQMVSSYLKEANITTAWFGGALDTLGPYTCYPRFKTPSALTSALKEGGFDVFFQTNHTLDYGEKGLRKTEAILKRYGITQVGAYVNQEESEKISLYQKGSRRVSFLNYTYGTNGIPISKPWMVKLIDPNKIKEDIVKAKMVSDFVVLALHFGEEYQRYPNEGQKRIARTVAKSGADLILGFHPHVLQPVELLELDDRRRVYVAYFLGNFLCGQRRRFIETGVILRAEIEKEKERVELKEIDYLPVWIAKYREGGRYQFKILPIKEALRLDQEKALKFLGEREYKRMKEAYEETITHLNKIKERD